MPTSGFDAASFQNSQFQTPGVAAPPETPKGPLVASAYAISGFTRSGAFRSDYLPISQWLMLRVGGVIQQYGIVDGKPVGIAKDSLVVTDNQNQTQDTCTFMYWGTPPTPGKEIVIAAGTFAIRLFGGAVQKVTQLPMKPGNPECWQVDCVDWWYFANRRRVYAKYLTFSADQIFVDIISRFTAGFTFDHVQAAPNITGGIEFNGESVEEALTQIANRIGWDFYIDAHKDFHFFELETYRAKALEPGKYHYWDLTYSEDLSQVRNRVFQQGGGGVTTAQVLPGATSIPIDVMSWYPTSGPNMRVQHGGQIIPYTAVVGNTLVVPAGLITHVIPQGDEVNIFVQVDDLASQAEIAALEGENSDGIHEYVASTDRRLSEQGAIDKATAELIAFNSASLSGSYKAFDMDARSGWLVEIRLPYRGAPLRDKRFKITSVTTTVRGAKRYFEKTITFGTTEKLDIFTALRGVI